MWLDRIVEIGIFKVFPNGNKEQYRWLVNPGIPIPAEAVQCMVLLTKKSKVNQALRNFQERSMTFKG